MRIAVIHNGNHDGVISKFGRPSPEKYSLRHVNMVLSSLRENGHDAFLMEGDVRLLTELQRQLPADPETGRPSGMVFNMAYGIQGEARYTHIPGILELAGIPYTGSTPLGHALALDKVITKILMVDAGIPTPKYKVIFQPEEPIGDLQYPLIVKPRHESTSYGLRLVTNRPELETAIQHIVETYRQSALVEEYIDGREVCIGILGNDNPEFLPPVELDFGDRGLKLMTWDDKFHKRTDEPKKVCPAPLEAEFIEQLNQISEGVFRACHLRDYARVDIRIDPHGNPFVLEINSMASLGDGGSFVAAAKAAGYSYSALVERIVQVTKARYDSATLAHASER
jgi:D-alanine-D-alanine ligase